jgi:cytochrome c biogenesis protein CcmG/thiol:disulfide interchange protein DsbE
MLLNVWATWCPACSVEHPYLVKLAKEKDVAIVGLNYKDDRNKALEWLSKLGDPYSINISDPEGRLGLDLGVYGAPETYVIDQQGIIRYRHVGIVDEKVWSQVLEPLMRQYGYGQEAGA